jgi:hypothetical protein
VLQHASESRLAWATAPHLSERRARQRRRSRWRGPHASARSISWRSSRSIATRPPASSTMLTASRPCATSALCGPPPGAPPDRARAPTP